MRREYPLSPIVAVGVIIQNDDQICLIQRDKEPSKGRWTFPGGAIELGEGLHEAARREALEETGLVVDVGEVATVIDNVVRDDDGSVRYHYVIVDFYATAVGGRLRLGTDVSDVKWASLADVKALDMTEKAQAIAIQLLAGLPAQ
jgi:ADP-ribose pyrophosphatase YjhB (NUDIX family)